MNFLEKAKHDNDDDDGDVEGDACPIIIIISHTKKIKNWKGEKGQIREKTISYHLTSSFLAPSLPY